MVFSRASTAMNAHARSQRRRWEYYTLHFSFVYRVTMGRKYSKSSLASHWLGCSRCGQSIYRHGGGI